jgi:hypothetical protein
LRIRTRKNLKKKNATIAFLFLLPILVFGSFAGIIFAIIYDVAGYTLLLEPPNREHFYDFNDINMTVLEELAVLYDDRMEAYTMPANITVTVNFKDRNYDDVDIWHGTDNGALAVGETLLVECLRYKWATENNKPIHLQNATRMITKSVTAFTNMIWAANGTLSRFAVPPGFEDIHPFMYAEHPRHFNGTGDYSQWRIRLYTSRDEVAGYFLGLASVLKYVTGTDAESLWCVERVKVLIDQVIETLEQFNFLIINGNGAPTGSDLNPIFEGSTWQLTLYRLGATALPSKYEGKYNYVAAKVLSMGGASMGDLMNADEDYYALSFGTHTMIALIILEDNPLLQYHYIKNFINDLYTITRYHRNAYFNAAYLMFMSFLSENRQAQFINPDYDLEAVTHDVADQLYRFFTTGWDKGVRDYNLIERPHSTRSTSLNPEIREMTLLSNKKEWRDFFENNMYGTFFSWIHETELIHFEEDLYMLPRTVSETGAGHFFWGSNAFKAEGGNVNGNGLTEAPAHCYLVPYYIMRAFNLL